ncbi:MAG TPA: metal-binding protein [Allocoleopsis sp.]
MPSGRTHDRITLWFLPLVAGSTLAVTHHSTLTLWVCAGFLWGGLMLGPDLDTFSLHYRRWGWLRWIWLPYRNSMRHRSPWSHSPIMGTTVRVIYLMAWLSCLSLIGVATLNEITHMGLSWVELFGFWGQLWHRYSRESIALFVGLELGAFSHYTADWLVSSHKRVKSKGWGALWQPKKRTKRSNSANRKKTGQRSTRKRS